MSDAMTAPQGFLSPAVRRLSRELGVDPRRIVGTGAGGRVTTRDVTAAASGDGTATIAPAPSDGLPRGAAWPGDEVIAFTPVRRRTAQNLRASIETAAHALVVTEVDYTAVDRARAVAETAGASYTYLPFVARAAIDAIHQYPEVNAVVDGDSLVVRGEMNLGVAVDLDFKGLVVPVIHGADSLRLPMIAAYVHDLADRARHRSLTADDLARGTFTITNAGRYGTLVTGPIINQPQVAILSTDGVKPRPVAVPQDGGGHAIAVHSIGNLSLSFDHRAFDGAYASAFLATIRDTLEQRDWEREL
jgi:2-oxoglutarate dehydrogenase E2 component (dihydrolipoamide succinyltransferase)